MPERHAHKNIKTNGNLWVNAVSLDDLPQPASDEHVQLRAGDEHDEAVFMDTCGERERQKKE